MDIQTFSAGLITKEQLTSDVFRLTFTHPPNFTFKAGQFVQIKFEKDGESKWRSYSIVNPPSHNSMIEVIVKLIDGGFASEVIKESHHNQKYEIKGPFGNFIYDESDTSENIVMICTGTGVAPFYSMLKEHLSKQSNKNFRLLFGVRTMENFFLKDKFEIMEKRHNNFKFVPVLSRQEWEGKQGHVQNFIPKPDGKTTYYICGLKDLVLDTEKLLMDNGVSESKIKKERYS
ncbi:FAD-dependent oxidoreductase [Candidatus Woesearchaeota archaeon]|nr:FAD-dependent oxidoreductase [Candidatus Woesearchaeota archaeon]MCF7901050.1 FAD-dependent oxidoreductase [Candidatus Woesearchaeota archaeon]MCF8013947.1 FAD-dependent oxidoreductase [Candidatus Woesearchaeota archaeon]